MMLFSMLSAAQGGKSIVFLSRHFGLSNRQMTNVIRHYLPILMRGIQKNFAKQGGLTTLLKTLDHGNYASYYEDPNIYSNPAVRSSGLSIMEQALGSEDIQRKVMHRIYLSTGIDPDTLHLVLPYITTLALSALYRKAHTSLNPSSMATGLEYHGGVQQQPQQQQYAQAAPQQVHHQRQAPRQQIPQQQAPVPQQQAPQHMPSPAQQQALQLMRQTQMFHQQQQQPQQHAPAPRQQHPTAAAHRQMQPQQAPVRQQQVQQPIQPQVQTQAAPVQTPIQTPQERLPNIILQAQEAHAKKQRKQSKKGRLSRMLKASFQVTDQSAQNENTPQHPPVQQANGGSYAAQNGHHAPAHSYFQSAPAPIQGGSTNLPQRATPSRKYVSLQEKLTSQLPWYEQTG